MSDLFKSSSSPADMASRKEALMDSVRSEVALANAQELINVWASERVGSRSGHFLVKFGADMSVKVLG
ncbi:hypothetical protein CCMSSC00406_0002063 [Pleurotus cornucopiae]|uniref:Uncharacterized protein n=1 Tax=Pleurotus cornucopiae TaxID=5321 RepID=A0ACB7J3U8_PLECO|nr:hypothetical protein CCMSSC00406_0002063 [Pleurotus cornucopiae]